MSFCDDSMGFDIWLTNFAIKIVSLVMSFWRRLEVGFNGCWEEQNKSKCVSKGCNFNFLHIYIFNACILVCTEQIICIASILDWNLINKGTSQS